MMDQNLFKKENIFTNKSFKDRKEVLEFLAAELFDRGKVETGFKDALLQREKNHPTGLSVGEINVAIPHADSIYVKESEVLLCTLKHPLNFQRMDDPNKEIDVSIIFLLAINSSEDHLVTLQKIISLIQDHSRLQKILNESDKNKINEILTIL